MPDPKSVKVDELSDDQIRQMMQRAKSMGYSDQDLIQLAQAEGVSVTEISKLSQRISAIRSGDNQKKSAKTMEKKAETNGSEKAKEQISIPINTNFGYSIFNDKTRNLSFETNLRIPTPVDYILGPGDEIVINIFGASEKNYTEIIKNDGQLILNNIGPVFISGLTLVKATSKIKARMSGVYKGLTGSNANTFIQVTVGKVRNIKVNLVGELNVPGTYTVNGLSTVFNALYVAGGPTLMGTLRDIKVYRKNKKIATVDVYDFLINGQTQNVRLQHDDVIIAGPYLDRVSIQGEVKRPGFYEMKPGETMTDLIGFAGGFTSKAYQDRVNLIRNTTNNKVVSDIFSSQFEIFETKGGDSYEVGQIQNRFSNRVMIKGAVFRPGNYSLTDQTTLKSLIETADGLRGDAFLNRALITRTSDNYSTQSITVDLGSVMDGSSEDPKLQKEDIVEILSIYDFREERFVRISGEVNAPGVFRYSDDLSIQDLLFLAKGFKKSATDGSITISRRPEVQSQENQIETEHLDIGKDLEVTNDEYILRPFDHVIVRRNPNYFEEKTIEITGQVNFPGKYSIKSAGERISDILERAGGINEFAYPLGATLIRKTEFYKSNAEAQIREENLLSVLGSIDSAIYSESDALVIDKISEELNRNESDDYSTNNIATQAKRDRLETLAENNSYLNDVSIRESESIALDLNKILSNPGSPEDLILEDGDIISIPKELSTIRMRGRVLYPNTVRYEEGKSLKYYIGQAGGFNSRAKKGRTYVVYANGSAARTKSFLFFKSFPKPAPGSEIIVPVKPLKVPIKTGDIVAISTSLVASMTLVAVAVLNNRTTN